MNPMERLADSFSLMVTLLGKMVAATHPTKFFLGLLTGLILSNVAPFLAAVYPELTWARGGAAISYPGYLAIGIMLWIAPTVFRKTQLSEENRIYIDLVETIIDKGNLSDIERRHFYRKMTEKALNSFNPKQGTSVDMKEALKELQQASTAKDDNRH